MNDKRSRYTTCSVCESFAQELRLKKNVLQLLKRVKIITNETIHLKTLNLNLLT